MKVKNLVANGWCPTCKRAKSHSYTLMVGGNYDNDPDAVELPETCKCGLTLANGGFSMVHEFDPSKELVYISKDSSILPNAPQPPANIKIADIFYHRGLSEEELRAMVRKLVAEALAEEQPKEVPGD